MQELLKKVRKIEIKARGLSSHLFTGGYHSAFKGRGMSFADVRPYQPGDDVRAIDWNVTARTGEAFVKTFEEERENTVMLLVDISGSAFFGSHDQFKEEYLTELCAVLAFSAIANNDRVGVLLFSDQTELFIPPGKGKEHILRIIREILSAQPKSRGTDMGGAFQHVHNFLKKRSVCFVLSDFLDNRYETPLRVLAKRHDCIGIYCWDALERDLPDVGVLRVADAETGAQIWVDTTSGRTRLQYAQSFDRHLGETRETFRKAGADFLSLRTNQPYVQALLNFFARRASIPLIFLFCSFASGLFAQNAVATLSTPAVETGDTFNLRIVVDETLHAPKPVDFSVWHAFLPEKNILSRSGWKQAGPNWGQNFTFIAFDSAYLHLPPLPIALFSGKTVKTNALQLSVRPTPAPANLSGMAPIREIRREPTFWYDYWPFLAGGAALLTLITWFFRRKPKPAPAPVFVAPAPPSISPEEVALQKLLALEKQKPTETAHIRAFCAELSLILREYLEKRHEIPALESTTREILAFLREKGFPEQEMEPVAAVLRETDKAKYAPEMLGQGFVEKAVKKVRGVLVAEKK